MDKQHQKEHAVLALLYDDYRRLYPQNINVMQCEIESVYHHLHQHHLPNAEEIAAVVLDICDCKSKLAFQEGLKTGVQLAMELELDQILIRCGVHEPACCQHGAVCHVPPNDCRHTQHSD